MPDVDLAPPRGSFLVAEAPTVRELPRLALRSPRLRKAPTGSVPIVTFPGYGTNDLALAPLRGYLRTRGHQPVGWGLGRNVDDVADRIHEATDVIRRHVERCDEPATLIGWSYGGVYAREIARDHPDLVRSIITLGTPAVGGPRYTRSVRFYSEERLARIDARVDERRSNPIASPLTAIYTKRDGAVDWRACLDPDTPGAEHVEVASTHNGLTLDPDVWLIIARELAGQ